MSNIVRYAIMSFLAGIVIVLLGLLSLLSMNDIHNQNFCLEWGYDKVHSLSFTDYHFACSRIHDLSTEVKMGDR